jgi:hypothetical protein
MRQKNKPSVQKDSLQGLSPDEPAVLKILKTLAVLKLDVSRSLRGLTPLLSQKKNFSGIQGFIGASKTMPSDKALENWIQGKDPSFALSEVFERFQEEALENIHDWVMDAHRLSQKIFDICLLKTEIMGLHRAISDTTSDPSLKNLARQLAAGELLSFRLLQGVFFMTPRTEIPGFYHRLSLCLKYLFLQPNEQIVTAYFVANTPKGAIFHPDFYRQAYIHRAFACYQKQHMSQKIQLVFKILGLPAPLLMRRVLGNSLWWFMSRKIEKSRNQVWA